LTGLLIFSACILNSASFLGWVSVLALCLNNTSRKVPAVQATPGHIYDASTHTGYI
jgi:hypothetical protein